MKLIRRDFLFSMFSAIPLLDGLRNRSAQRLQGEVGVGAPDSTPVVVSRLETPLMSVVRQRLATYLTSLTGTEPRFSTAASAAQRQILLGDSSLAREFHLPLPPARRGSFTVGLVTRGNQSSLVIAGHTDEGVKRGVYHVMQHLSFTNGELVLPSGTVESSPFFAGRVTHTGGFVTDLFATMSSPNAYGQGPATSAQLAWNHWDRWELERIPDYIDMLDFFGYNAIESEPGQLVADKSNSTEKALVDAKRSIFVDRIRRNGMAHGVHVTATLDGDVPYRDDTKQRYEDYYNSLAQSVGPHVDWAMTHWLDSGGWKSTPEQPCTIEVLQNLHMQVHRAFKKANPKTETILGLWALDKPGFGTSYMKWDGYRGVDSILQSGKIPPEVGLAMGQTYRPAEAKKIVAAGHKSSVWGWYLDDNELVYTMHVHSHILQSYLRNVPDEARDLVDFHSLSDCQAETNIYTIYLGARMLWNPRESPEVYLREIARLVYGPKLEAAVFAGLKSIADVRCGKRCRGYWNPGFGGRKDFNGIVTFDQALAQSTAAWEGLKDLQIDRTYVLPLQFHRPVPVLLQELKGHVEAVAKYMQCLQDRDQKKSHPTEVPAADGPFEYYERVKYLHPEAIWWPATLMK